MIFGIVVAILLYIQFIYAFLLSRRIKDHNSILLNCSKYMILNYFLTSFFTGNIYKSPSIVVLFIAVIIAHGFPQKKVEAG